MFMIARILALASAVAAWSPGTAPLTRNAHVRISMVDAFRWSTAKAAVAGDKADLSAAPADITWAKAAWESVGKEASDSVSDECYMISDLAPDASKEWFFCSSPAEDPAMTCEAMPSYMGTLPDGSTVYICSIAKVAAE